MTYTTNTDIELAYHVFDIEASSVLKLKEKINEQFLQAIDIIYHCQGRTIVTGIGKSGVIGKKISSTLSSTGTPSFFLHPAESTHGDSGAIMKGDVIIAISNSGETEELLKMIPLLKRFGLEIIAFTGNLHSTLAQNSNVVIDVSVEKEACPLNLAPTASTTATLAMGDAIAVVLLHKRGFNEDDFLQYHPSGSLGRSLLYKVEDLMHQGDKLPLVLSNTLLIDGVKIISEHRLGVGLVVNHESVLLGIVTDGDLRRTIEQYRDVKHLKVDDVMTKNPRTIDCHTMTATALHIMEKFAITSLAVVNENHKVIGLLHIHELLRAGVV